MERQYAFPWRQIEENLIDWLPEPHRVKRLLRALWRLSAQYGVDTAGGNVHLDPPETAILATMQAGWRTFAAARAAAAEAGYLSVEQTPGRTCLYTLHWDRIFRGSDFQRPPAVAAADGGTSPVRCTPEAAPFLNKTGGTSAQNRPKTGRVRASGTERVPPVAPDPEFLPEKNSGPDRTGPGFFSEPGPGAHAALPDWPELRELAARRVTPLEARTLQHAVFEPLRLFHLQNASMMLEWHRRQLSADWPAMGGTLADAALVLAAALYASSLPDSRVKRSRVGLFVDVVRHGKWWKVRSRLPEAIRRVQRAAADGCSSTLSADERSGIRYK